MSREHTIWYAAIALNRTLQAEGIEERFSAHELELLSQYQNIKAQKDWKYRLNCASLALEELRQQTKYREATLTEFGVATAFENYGNSVANYMEASVRATKAFLLIWERVMNEQVMHRAQLLRTLTDETRAKVDYAFLKPMLGQVVSRMQQNGFRLQNSSDLDQPASQMLEHGLVLRFENSDGAREEMTFFLPGGQLVMTDFHAAPGADLSCGNGAESCLALVIQSVRELSRVLGVPMGASLASGSAKLTGAPADLEGSPSSSGDDARSVQA